MENIPKKEKRKSKLLCFPCDLSNIQKCNFKECPFTWVAPFIIIIPPMFLCTLLNVFWPPKFCSPYLFSCLQGWECNGWNNDTIAQVLSSLGFRWTLLFLVYCVHILPMCVCPMFLCTCTFWAFGILLPFLKMFISLGV